MSTIDIDPRVALREQTALAEHYRNRALVLGQALEDQTTKLTNAEQRLIELQSEEAE